MCFQEGGLIPSQRNKIIRALLDNGCEQKAKECFMEMLQAKEVPDLDTYRAFIRTFRRQKRKDEL